IVSRSSNPDATVDLAFLRLSVFLSLCMLGYVYIAERICCYSTAAIEPCGKLHDIPLFFKALPIVPHAFVEHRRRVPCSFGERLRRPVPCHVYTAQAAKSKMRPSNRTDGDRPARLIVHSDR